jgi:hypothetical protein
MSRSLGNQLPPQVLALLDGRNLGDKTDFALLLNTVDAGGHPHPAMLSVGEVLARGPSALRLALYPNSSTSKNLRRGGGLSMALAHGGLAYYVKATAREIDGAAAHLGGQAGFEAAIDEVLEDGDPSAQVTSGFTLSLTRESARTLAEWEQRISALATLP